MHQVHQGCLAAREALHSQTISLQVVPGVLTQPSICCAGAR